MDRSVTAAERLLGLVFRKRFSSSFSLSCSDRLLFTVFSSACSELLCGSSGFLFIFLFDGGACSLHVDFSLGRYIEVIAGELFGAVLRALVCGFEVADRHIRLLRLISSIYMRTAPMTNRPREILMSLSSVNSDSITQLDRALENLGGDEKLAKTVFRDFFVQVAGVYYELFSIFPSLFF